MSAPATSGSAATPAARTELYRRVLWIVLAINAAMFVVEGGAGLGIGSVALQADSLDFLGDAANYGLALWVLGQGLRWRAITALLKAATMACFGVWIIVTAIVHAFSSALPDAGMMAGVGTLALVANLASAALLFRHRGGDSNRRAVWLCTRNDALGNVAVLLAAAAVGTSATAWPDLAVGVLLATLALSSATTILRQAAGELRSRDGVVPRS